MHKASSLLVSKSSKALHGNRRALSSSSSSSSSFLLSNDSFSQPLERMSEIIDTSLYELSGLRKENPTWNAAFESLIGLNKSPRRHLFRPQLVLLGASYEKRKDVNVEKFCAGVELHHIFTLIHDDIMDRATIRRGLPTLSVSLSKFVSSKEKIASLATLIGKGTKKEYGIKMTRFNVFAFMLAGQAM